MRRMSRQRPHSIIPTPRSCGSTRSTAGPPSRAVPTGGGQLLTRAHSSSYTTACPHLRAPGASVPDGRTIRRNQSCRSRDQRRRHLHTGYQSDREHVCRRAASDDPIEGLPLKQNSARDGLQARQGCAEKLAPARWSQPVAKADRRCESPTESRSPRNRPHLKTKPPPDPSGRQQDLAMGAST
jgi:hypothetical protein